MALLNILQFPDPRLKIVAESVKAFDAALVNLVNNMFETLYEAHGVGLAASQVNVHQRIIVIDVSHNQKQPLCLVNPEILQKHGTVTEEEGCLSFPSVYAKVQRAKEVEIIYFDQFGKQHELTAKGLLGICIQHEIDHLNGITFFDHLSQLKQQLLQKKLDKYRKRAL